MKLYTFMDLWMRAWPGLVLDAWLSLWQQSTISKIGDTDEQRK
jgi:hypothetical protein